MVQLDGMDEIRISEFKATCLAVLARVGETGRPMLITRHGKPVAQIMPPPCNAADWLGAMRGRGVIKGDLVESSGSSEDWEVLNDLDGAAANR